MEVAPIEKLESMPDPVPSKAVGLAFEFNSIYTYSKNQYSKSIS
jgi:hypothetical protein